MHLGLIITDICPRDCELCVNKQYDLSALPRCESFAGYTEILLTGGEPMLFPEDVKALIPKIRAENPTAQIYVYTAEVRDIPEVLSVLEMADGLTVTLHEQEDVVPFLMLSYDILRLDAQKGKSLRVNIFEGVTVEDKCALAFWKVKDNIKWLNPCPLPESVVFMRL